jgi:hypothetical protein
VVVAEAEREECHGGRATAAAAAAAAIGGGDKKGGASARPWRSCGGGRPWSGRREICGPAACCVFCGDAALDSSSSRAVGS